MSGARGYVGSNALYNSYLDQIYKTQTATGVVPEFELITHRMDIIKHFMLRIRVKMPLRLDYRGDRSFFFASHSIRKLLHNSSSH